GDFFDRGLAEHGRLSPLRIHLHVHFDADDRGRRVRTPLRPAELAARHGRCPSGREPWCQCDGLPFENESSLCARIPGLERSSRPVAQRPCLLAKDPSVIWLARRVVERRAEAPRPRGAETCAPRRARPAHVSALILVALAGALALARLHTYDEPLE